MMKNYLYLLSFVLTVLFSAISLAQQQGIQQTPTPALSQQSQQFSEAELAQMLAPIALYPDSLLTHILIASTYPIEIVEADRWLKKNTALSAKEKSQLLESFDWDASVKALVAFERVLNKLSEDLNWTQQLGDAFLQDEAKLLTSIQALRKNAELSGNLDKMANMNVSYEDDNIVIEPAEKEVVYVPYYDTRMIYGAWYWPSYPPVYWPPHHSVYVSHYNPFYWHSGINISFNYFFSAFHWSNRQLVVVNPHRSSYYHGRHQITRGGYAKRWLHQPAHRKGVAYRGKHISKKYHSNRGNLHRTNKQAHLSQRNNTERHFKQNLAVKNHAVTNRQNQQAHTKNSTISRQGSKPHKTQPHIASVKSKGHSENIAQQQNIHATKTTAKSHSKNIKTHSKRDSRSSRGHANKSQGHQSKSVRGHQSQGRKSRHN